MSIFNSLGSNYNFNFVLRSVFAANNGNYHRKLTSLLEKEYDGRATLLYKGRDAIRLALRTINKSEEYVVAICGFTCFAVYEAVVKEGYQVEYLDIEKDSLNFSIETLKNAIKKNPKIRIVIVQNTLGSPCDIEDIAIFAREKNIILIEDLAHSIGAIYRNNKLTGTVGDFTMLAFSQDKMIDGITGGALIIRNSKFKIENLELDTLEQKQQQKDRLYPLWTFLIRKTYGIRIGKILHAFLKKADLLSKPVENFSKKDLRALPFWNCGLILDEFEKLDKNLKHRKIIAEIYEKIISKKIQLSTNAMHVHISSNLRFSIFVENRVQLIKFLKKYKIFISDIWYDAPVSPKRYLDQTSYRNGECHNSEYISERILNLPTHKNVSEKDARFIAEKVNEWFVKQ